MFKVDATNRCDIFVFSALRDVHRTAASNLGLGSSGPCWEGPCRSKGQDKKMGTVPDCRNLVLTFQHYDFASRK